MINRFVPAMVCLLFVLMPGAGWQTHDASLSRRDITRNGTWLKDLPPGMLSIRAPRQPYPAKAGVSLPVVHPKTQLPNTTRQLWYDWERRLNRSELQQIPIIGTLLAGHLHKHPEPEVYLGIADLLAQPDMPMANKAVALDLLAEIATPDSLDVLIGLAEQGVDNALYPLVLQALSRIGDNRWDGKFHEELSPALEAAWTNPANNDPAFLGAVGNAIAAIGAPTGVGKLLATVSGEQLILNGSNASMVFAGTEGVEAILSGGRAADARAADFYSSYDFAVADVGALADDAPSIYNPALSAVVVIPTDVDRQSIAFDVISQVRNPDAVNVLGAAFLQTPLEMPAFETSGMALAEIGTPEATQIILDWALNAPSEGVRNLTAFLDKIDDDKSLALISSYADYLGDIAFDGSTANDTAVAGLANDPVAGDATNKKIFQSPEIQAVIDTFAASLGSNTELTGTADALTPTPPLSSGTDSGLSH